MNAFGMISTSAAIQAEVSIRLDSRLRVEPAITLNPLGICLMHASSVHSVVEIDTLKT